MVGGVRSVDGDGWLQDMSLTSSQSQPLTTPMPRKLRETHHLPVEPSHLLLQLSHHPHTLAIGQAGSSSTSMLAIRYLPKHPARDRLPRAQTVSS
jgi:hypothetical protein